MIHRETSRIVSGSFVCLARRRITLSILASFLDAVTVGLKNECSQLSRDRRRVLPAYESVLDLTEHVIDLRKTSIAGAIERVLSLVFQLGSFIAEVP